MRRSAESSLKDRCPGAGSCGILLQCWRLQSGQTALSAKLPTGSNNRSLISPFSFECGCIAKCRKPGPPALGNRHRKGGWSPSRHSRVSVQIGCTSRSADPIVRVDARRLRDKLREHYVGFPLDPVLISLPKGGYVPAFRENLAAPASSAPTINSGVEPPVRWFRWRWVGWISALD